MSRARVAVSVASALAVLLPGPARADGDTVVERAASRPHTTAEVEAGILALPNAPISPVTQGGSTPFGKLGKGDATVMVGFHLLYRPKPTFAIGAGALLGPRPTSDNVTTPGGPPETHSRSYLWVGAEARYVPIHYRSLEAWVGLNAGGILVADRYDNNSGGSNPEFVGPWNINEVTVRTEGFSLGLQIGADWLFAEAFVLGLGLRYDRWVLPNNQGCSPLGDCATLTGSVSAFEGGLTFGYRLPL